MANLEEPLPTGAYTKLRPAFLLHDDVSEDDEAGTQTDVPSSGDEDRSGEATIHPPELKEHDGMLPRDLPKRTTFYDPVAEKQMSQTDAKLFYQMSQASIGPSVGPASLDRPSSPPGPSEAAGSPAITAQVQRLAVCDRCGGAGTGPAPGHSVYGIPSPQRPGAGEDEIPPWANSHGLLGVPEAIGAGRFSDADSHVTAELSSIATKIQRVRDLRRRYMALSLQGPDDNPRDSQDWSIYPPPPEPAWIQENTKPDGSVSNSLSNSMILTSDATRRNGEASSEQPQEPHQGKGGKKRKPGQNIGEDFNMDDLLPLPPASGMTFELDESGVYQVFCEHADDTARVPFVKVPTIREYYMDLDEILNISSDGPAKSYAFRRLQYLEGQFNMYVLLNGYQETADSKRVPHRDFYNVRKVDTHVHHSACMNQKHLLRFIKSKMKKCPDEVVLFRDGRLLTLAEVFQSINLTAYDLSIDTLDMHAHTDSFHRFDKFNLKYNPIGESRLRTIFLKTDNYINGRYLAEITKEVIMDIESSKYQMVEWRISIYGKSIDEWDKLAAWVVDNKLFSHNVRWLIQIPRLYDVYKASGLMETFEQVVKNVFQPLFEVTKDPSSHPKLHIFLQRVIGFDSVDDESKPERRLFKKFPVPRVWDSGQNPPYSYWIYYLFANLVSLNNWRKQRGFSTFAIRPHCGEAGDSDHLAVAALSCHSISHGLLLRKVPLLQYVFYLEQIGIAMSPLSNNALFLAYERNPFHQYFKRGLNVSLSTDDPLQFAFTKEPLIEEYAVAAQIYKLSPVDMCELAKNSVKQSGYEHSIKQQWLGADFRLPGKAGNKVDKTNVPDRREEFRYQVLREEREVLRRYIGDNIPGPSSSEPKIFPGIVSRGQRSDSIRQQGQAANTPAP